MVPNPVGPPGMVPNPVGWQKNRVNNVSIMARERSLFLQALSW